MCRSRSLLFVAVVFGLTALTRNAAADTMAVETTGAQVPTGAADSNETIGAPVPTGAEDSNETIGAPVPTGAEDFNETIGAQAPTGDQ